MAETSGPDSGRLSRLTEHLDPAARILVQTHDYPDIDAVAAAWALSGLLARRGWDASVVYRGEIRSRSLKRLVAELGIGFGAPAAGAERERPPQAAGPEPGPRRDIIVVDGSPSNGNVSLFPGRLVGVVDHHFPVAVPEAPYLDLRPEVASCSSMAYEYWRGAGETPPPGVATALIAGIQADTEFLSRRSSPADFGAFGELIRIGDWEGASRIVRTALDARELLLVAEALARARVEGGLLYAMAEGPCGQEALAVTADFALRAEELEVAVMAERDESGVHFSLRSKSPALSAFALVRLALEGIGSGGGHSHAAGGIVPAASRPSDDELRRRFFEAAAALRREGGHLDQGRAPIL